MTRLGDAALGNAVLGVGSALCIAGGAGLLVEFVPESTALAVGAVGTALLLFAAIGLLAG